MYVNVYIYIQLYRASKHYIMTSWFAVAPLSMISICLLICTRLSAKYIWVGDWGRHRFRSEFVNKSPPDHHEKQCWLIVNKISKIEGNSVKINMAGEGWVKRLHSSFAWCDIACFGIKYYLSVKLTLWHLTQTIAGGRKATLKSDRYLIVQNSQ